MWQSEFHSSFTQRRKACYSKWCSNFSCSASYTVLFMRGQSCELVCLCENLQILWSIVLLEWIKSSQYLYLMFCILFITETHNHLLPATPLKIKISSFLRQRLVPRKQAEVDVCILQQCFLNRLLKVWHQCLILDFVKLFLFNQHAPVSCIWLGWRTHPAFTTDLIRFSMHIFLFNCSRAETWMVSKRYNYSQLGH